jgi:hypothetical protein
MVAGLVDDRQLAGLAVRIAAIQATPESAMHPRQSGRRRQVNILRNAGA